jgi:uncharacterized membrane protein YcaP (DUF421 family)
MDSVIKSIIVYFVLWLVIRVSGRRTLGQLTVFDFILFLIIGGAAQRALMAQDYSLTHAFLVIATFVLIDIAVSLIERRVPGIGKILKGVPTIVVDNGRVLSGRLRRALTPTTTFGNSAMPNGSAMADQMLRRTHEGIIAVDP